MAGRDALLDDTARALEVGPEHPRFCRALLGSRGTGKTVLLDVVGDVAAKKLGWGVLHVQALPEESQIALFYRRLSSPGSAWAGVPGTSRRSGPTRPCRPEAVPPRGTCTKAKIAKLLEKGVTTWTNVSPTGLTVERS